MAKFYKMEQRSDEWYAKRNGKITGTGLQKILGTDKAKETFFYETLAQRFSPNLLPKDENPRDRGIRLEPDARTYFEKKYKKKVDCIGFVESDENSSMGYSPDGLIKTDGYYLEDIEIKCPEGANYMRAVVKKEIPKEYYAQNLQAFIVHPGLQKRYFILYNPDITICPMVVFIINRKDILKEIKETKEKELDFITSLNRQELVTKQESVKQNGQKIKKVL